jgi:hypothetical protein
MLSIFPLIDISTGFLFYYTFPIVPLVPEMYAQQWDPSMNSGPFSNSASSVDGLLPNKNDRFKPSAYKVPFG